jgi:ActR/RegA family two-component response regulator
MTNHQAAAVIREAIKDAAKEVGCKPSEAHDPPTANRAGIHARNAAIVAAHRQGVSKDQLTEAFRRSWETVNNVLLQEARNVKDHSPIGAVGASKPESNSAAPIG